MLVEAAPARTGSGHGGPAAGGGLAARRGRFGHGVVGILIGVRRRLPAGAAHGGRLRAGGEARLDPAAGGAAVGGEGLARIGPGARGAAGEQAGTQRQEGVGQGAQRDHGAALDLLVLRVIGLVFLDLLLRHGAAAGDEQAAGAEGEADAAHHHLLQEGVEPAGEQQHEARNEVAHHPAEAGGHGPGAEGGEGAEEGAGAQRPHRQGQHPEALALQRAVGQEPPAPHRQGQHDGERGEPEQLHQQIGDHRAGPAEQVVDLGVGGVGQAGIARRPAHHRHQREHRRAQHHRAADLRGPAPDRRPHRLGDEVHAHAMRAHGRGGPGTTADGHRRALLRSGRRRGGSAPPRWWRDHGPWRP